MGVLLAAAPRPTSAIWVPRPPECDNACVEIDNHHPLAKCPVEVLDAVAGPRPFSFTLTSFKS